LFILKLLGQGAILAKKRKKVKLLSVPKQTLRFSPEFHGPIEGFVVNYTIRNFWRVAHIYEFEDLYQDAHMLFLKCCEQYPHVVDAPHFFALFKRTYVNHITDLANDRTAEYAIIPHETRELDENELEDTPAEPWCYPDAELVVLLKQMPTEVQKLIIGLLTDAERFTEHYQPRLNGTNIYQRRQTTNERWCAALGLNPEDYNLVDTLRGQLEDTDANQVPLTEPQ
jgi:hypothetical protein